MSVVQSKLSQEQLVSLLDENMGLVVSLAQSFNPKDDDELDEFVQIGRIATWEALQTYNPDISKVTTYLWRPIKWAILRHISKQRKDVSLDTEIDVADNRRTESLWEYLPDYLTWNEQQVIQMRLKGYKFEEIGNKLGYSKWWANHIYIKALKKINNANKKKTHFNV